jgi:hypothetical protein
VTGSQILVIFIGQSLISKGSEFLISRLDLVGPE